MTRPERRGGDRLEPAAPDMALTKAERSERSTGRPQLELLFDRAADPGSAPACDRCHLPRRRTEPRVATLAPEFDAERLRRQRERVRAFMADGCWHTLGEISAATGAPEASASARLRDLRRAGEPIEARRLGESGLWVYRARAASHAS